MWVHQRLSAFFSRAARGNCRNLHLALESSASPRREGERIEVRGFVNLQIQCAEPSPYSLPWEWRGQHMQSSCGEMSRYPSENNAQENWPTKLIAGVNFSSESKTS